MKKPLISIIIPAHNGESYLAEALESVLRQTYRPIEILVIDNASKDRTRYIAQSFPEVRYFYSDEAHTALARNRGIQEARGEFIAFLDQDDLWVPDKLAKQAAFLEANPYMSGVICLQKMTLQAGHQKPHWLKQKFLETPQPGYLPSALLVRHSALEKTGRFDSAYSLSSDVDWFFKAKHTGIEIGMLSEALVIRRIHNENASHKSVQAQSEILSVIRSSLQARRGKVSIIIPVYNGARYLKEAIDSALAQDYANKEIIVINDGSTDATASILQDFSSRIIAIHQTNQGLGAARNAGVRAASGDYLAFLDHDDFWEPNKLTLQMNQMNRHDPLVFGFIRQFICPSLTQEEKSKLSVNEEIMPAYLAGSLLISKKRFWEIGPFFEKNTVGEFIDWYARALDARVPMVMLPHLTLHRRVHRDNMGRSQQQYSRLEYLKILKNSLDRRRKSHATSS